MLRTQGHQERGFFKPTEREIQRTCDARSFRPKRSAMSELDIAFLGMESIDGPPSSPAEAKLRRLLPGIIASWIVLLGLVVVIGYQHPDRWNGAYLIWGIAVGLVGAIRSINRLFITSPRRGLNELGWTFRSVPAQLSAAGSPLRIC